MAESGVPIATPLQLLVAPEHAGKIIGRRGGRIQEVQIRTGARIQLSDQGDEKKIEISGPQSCVDDAVAMMLQDLSPPVKEQQHPKAQPSSALLVAVIIPEALAPWVSGALGQRSGFEMDDLTVSAQSNWGEVSERKVALQGAVDVVIEALRLVNLHVQRYNYWGVAGMRELPWHSGDVRQDGDPEESFISTVNIRLILSERVAQALIDRGFVSTLLPQIQDDTGAVVRRHAGPPAGMEIAGGFGGKLRALMGVSIMLLNLDSDSGAGLQLLLPSAGPSAVKASELQELCGAHGVEGSLKRAGAGDGVLARLTGPRDGCSAAAVALYRRMERAAKEHERAHGPPPLLIDYLSRWFGRDATRFQGSFFAGPARGRANDFVLPVSQLADRGAHTLVGLRHEQGHAAGSQPAAAAPPAPGGRAYGPAPEPPPPPPTQREEEGEGGGPGPRDRSASASPDAERRPRAAKRRRRRRGAAALRRLSNPFDAWRPGSEPAAGAGGAASDGEEAATAPARGALAAAAAEERGPGAEARPPAIEQPGPLVGYSDDESDPAPAPMVDDVSDVGSPLGNELDPEPVAPGDGAWRREDGAEAGSGAAALPDGGVAGSAEEEDFFWGSGTAEAGEEEPGAPLGIGTGMGFNPWAPQLLQISAAPFIQQGDPLTERKRSLLEKLARL